MDILLLNGVLVSDRWQTLRDHEDAWGAGGFNFTGRVHDDGLIVFSRQPVSASFACPSTVKADLHVRRMMKARRLKPGSSKATCATGRPLLARLDHLQLTARAVFKAFLACANEQRHICSKKSYRIWHLSCVHPTCEYNYL